MIKSLEEMVDSLSIHKKKRLAVACAEDPNTISAIHMAVKKGFVEAIMIGDTAKIKAVALEKNICLDNFELIHIADDVEATKKAVSLVKNGDADALMKGLVATDKYLKAVLNKEHGLLVPKAIMSHVTVLDVPAYDKLLFLADVAVLPFPDINQKVSMINYAVKMCQAFGINNPRVALLAATEKVNPAFENTIVAAELSKMAHRQQIKNAIVDGPLDVFLACDKESIKIKGVKTPIDGEADVLIFPNIEAGNIFYKGAMLFGKGELAALIQGTTHPVIVTSRSESTLSKYYSIALACLMAKDIHENSNCL